MAEEVTLKGGRERRPDVVLYVNGIAVGVLELKYSRVSVGEGSGPSRRGPAANGTPSPRNCASGNKGPLAEAL